MDRNNNFLSPLNKNYHLTGSPYTRSIQVNDTEVVILTDSLKKSQIAERRKSSGDSQPAVVIKTEKDIEQTERRKSMRIIQTPRRLSMNDEADKVVKNLRRQSVTATKLKPGNKPIAKMRIFQHIKEEEEEEATIKIVKPKLRRKSIAKDTNSKIDDVSQPEPTWNFIKMLFEPPAPNPIELFDLKRTIVAERRTLDGKREFLVQRE